MYEYRIESHLSLQIRASKGYKKFWTFALRFHLKIDGRTLQFLHEFFGNLMNEKTLHIIEITIY